MQSLARPLVIVPSMSDTSPSVAGHEAALYMKEGRRDTPPDAPKRALYCMNFN